MIRYFANRQIAIEDLLPLYQSVSWTNYTERADMLEQAFQHSLFTVSAYDGEQLVGLLRAVGDGFSSVFIQDLLVFRLISAKVSVENWFDKRWRHLQMFIRFS